MAPRFLRTWPRSNLGRPGSGPAGGQPEIDRYEPETLEGWVVLVVGSAHQVDTETERASITSAGADPRPEAESKQFVRVQPMRISGRRRRRP
jgi:hypothetical protein